jgi:uncharacterized protein
MSYSFYDMAIDVLKTATKPLTYQEVWRICLERKLDTKLKTKGKTPWQSLGARLYVEVRDNPDSSIVPVGTRPMRFFLKERADELPKDIVAKIEREEAKEPKKTVAKAGFLERDLHPLLAYYAYAIPSFNRGKGIYTKTIFHEKSTKSGYNEWTHPDMVGFYLPLKDWQPNVIELNRVSDNNSLKLFSFELKRSLTRATYRASYFQAVSNSSWAHEGYLVSADILDDDDLLGELERLASSFGIGIIHLDIEDVDSSRIVFPARSRDTLDWPTINKLCDQNKDFEKFLKDIKIDFEAREIHTTKYDPVQSDAPILKRGSGR